MRASGLLVAFGSGKLLAGFDWLRFLGWILRVESRLKKVVDMISDCCRICRLNRAKCSGSLTN